MARMLTRMTRWLACSHIIHTHLANLANRKSNCSAPGRHHQGYKGLSAIVDKQNGQLP